jgi:hypothetical protein
MSKQGVKHVIAALLSDPHFKKAFFANKKKTLKESGFTLTPAEMKALQHIRKLDVKNIIDKVSDIVLPMPVKPPHTGERKRRTIR